MPCYVLDLYQYPHPPTVYQYVNITSFLSLNKNKIYKPGLTKFDVHILTTYKVIKITLCGEIL